MNKTTKKIEAISASELANKLRARIEKGEDDLMHLYYVYIGSLNLEVMSSILKSQKNEENNAWFFTSMGNCEDQYLTALIIDTEE